MNKKYKSFLLYHYEHPEVYQEFKKIINLLKSKNRRFCGAKAIIEYIRFNFYLKTDTKYKINNNHTSFYVRKYENETGDTTFFRKRKSVADGVVEL